MSDAIHCGRCGDESQHGVAQDPEDRDEDEVVYSTKLCSECQLIESDNPYALAASLFQAHEQRGYDAAIKDVVAWHRSRSNHYMGLNHLAAWHIQSATDIQWGDAKGASNE